MQTVATQANERMLDTAIAMLSQQCWCWGRDILRPSGNWLLENGFERLEPPSELKDGSSVYRLSNHGGDTVILRGFGVFLGQTGVGGIFLPRFEFAPRYTRKSLLKCPPWTSDELCELAPPNRHQRIQCGSLLLRLLDWIRQYEVNIVERLGIEYRRQTLAEWKSDGHELISAERFASEWRRLSLRIAANIDGALKYDAAVEGMA